MSAAPRTLEERLLARRAERGCLWAVLLDPESSDPAALADCASKVEQADADLLLVGGSSADPATFAAGVRTIRGATSLPIVLFPGSYHQVVAGAHGILFTSLLSGRNPRFLVEEQVKGAPRVLQNGLEPLPTAYLLIESGVPTTVQKVSGTNPLPAEDIELVLHHTLAARLMGMRWAYLEAGSGAQRPVPTAMVREVATHSGVSVIVGGGLRSPEAVAERSQAGATMIVTGNVIEAKRDASFLRAMSAAVHTIG